MLFYYFPTRGRLVQALAIAFLSSLINGTAALHRPGKTWRGSSFVDCKQTLSIALNTRGGSAKQNSEPIELNPDYHHYIPPRNEHDAWLQQQQQQTTFTFGRRKEPSLIERAQNYFVVLHELSPSLFSMTLSCIGVFAMWQIPRFTRRPNSLLYKWFVNSRANLKHTFGLSLVMSSLSHISPYHLLVNLMTLSQLGPSVKLLINQSQRFRRFPPRAPAMWPLLVSSAAFSNALFLAGSKRGASSLGLSGVTMALMAIQARAYPDRRYGMIIGVIPISLKAKHMLQLLLVVSLIGSWSSSSLRRNVGGSNIAHLAHLGGLVYGMIYYELVVQNQSPHQLLDKMLRSLFG